MFNYYINVLKIFVKYDFIKVSKLIKLSYSDLVLVIWIFWRKERVGYNLVRYDLLFVNDYIGFERREFYYRG